MGENRRDRFGLTIVEWVCPATDAGLSCLKRGGGAIWHLQLGQHLRDVVAHGLLRHAEPARDLMVAASGRDQLEYFAFARGQVGDSFPSRKTQPSRGTSVPENRSWRCAMLRPTPPTASPEDDRRVKRRSVRGWSAAVAVAAALAMTGGPASARIAETTHFAGTLHEAAENPCTGGTRHLRRHLRWHRPHHNQHRRHPAPRRHCPRHGILHPRGPGSALLLRRFHRP
jgi:hypothetical protein